MDIHNKNIVLTGASSGIGLAVLKLLLDYKGVRIVAVARHIETIPSIDGIVFPFSADLSNKRGVDSLFEYAQSVFVEIDVFIANAGYAFLEKLSNPDWKHTEDIFALNTFSPIYSLQKFAESGTNKPRCFVGTISAVAQVPLPYYSLYCSTKAALHQFIEAFRYEAASDLQVMAVYPVATRTAFFEKAANGKQPLIPFLSQTAETVAKAIVKGIEQDKKRVYPSFLFRIFKLFGGIFPFIFPLYSALEKRKVDKRYHL
ncbi:short-subunit dehydrogenase [Dysgonomonas alginatilytica]|uniref:Short-subunit dehydrogenase n=1 Tax=Dysgonomonas alginatilytica TaxID=1605892 RepID=A0A2V3PU56_9BACT|nr:SDR family NAD(P)-dependent oxidoreductase [Dysgonomonas alginatilytica]PXV67430.1 short-subunit dehydrogenase [Dysgonomonas alginatilytica]